MPFVLEKKCTPLVLHTSFKIFLSLTHPLVVKPFERNLIMLLMRLLIVSITKMKQDPHITVYLTSLVWTRSCVWTVKFFLKFTFLKSKPTCNKLLCLVNCYMRTLLTGIGDSPKFSYTRSLKSWKLSIVCRHFSRRFHLTQR